MESDKVEIVDFSGENFKKITIPCSYLLVIIILISFLNIYLMVAFPGSFISIFVSLILFLIFILYYSYIIKKDPGKIRRFFISFEKIEIELPHNPIFTIFWNEFKKVEIRLREFNCQPYKGYEFHFSNQEDNKVCTISLMDFHKEKIEQILTLLKDFSRRMKKEFTAVKETNVSGIYLVENLKI
ncbi:MAG: hypothetical protein ACFE9I_13030 [Candidatus Hermodarchaeota archaeon]